MNEYNFSIGSAKLILNFSQTKSCFTPEEVNNFILSTIQGEYLILISVLLCCCFILSLGILKQDKELQWGSFALMLTMALIYWVLYLVRY